jgi:hypothetical protein
MEMKEAMIMCTCAERNSELYLKYIKDWIEQYNTIQYNTIQYNTIQYNIDLYVINDGYVSSRQLEEYGIKNVNFINLCPALGRKSLSIFPGFCRSLAEGLKFSLQYKYFAIVENDLKLLSINKFNKLLHTKNRCFSGYSQQNKFIESSLLIINDINVRKEILSYYSIPENQFKEHCVEKQVEFFLQKGKYEKRLKGARYEGMPERLKFCRDYVAQYYDKHGDNSDVDKLVAEYRKVWIYYPNMFACLCKRMYRKILNKIKYAINYRNK